MLCKECWWTLYDIRKLSTFCSQCSTRQYTLYWEEDITDILWEKEKHYYEEILRVIGGNMFYEIFQSVGVDWVIFASKGRDAGWLPWEFWRVKDWVKKKDFEQLIYLFWAIYSRKLPLSWDYAYLLINTFYSESNNRKVKKYYKWNTENRYSDSVIKLWKLLQKIYMYDSIFDLMTVEDPDLVQLLDDVWDNFYEFENLFWDEIDLNKIPNIMKYVEEKYNAEMNPLVKRILNKKTFIS